MEILIGAVVSILAQFAKKYGKNEWQTLIMVLVLSLVSASIYTALVAVGYWQTVGMVLMTAGAFYTYVIQRFE